MKVLAQNGNYNQKQEGNHDINGLSQIEIEDLFDKECEDKCVFRSFGNGIVGKEAIRPGQKIYLKENSCLHFKGGWVYLFLDSSGENYLLESNESIPIPFPCD